MYIITKHKKQFILWPIKILCYRHDLLVHYPFQKDEIQVKWGGDHGADSYKQGLQICNTKNPNSKENTSVVCIFEAKDTKQNLRIALTQYKDQIAELQQKTWM